MGIWDYYRPNETVKCPLCSGTVMGWTSKSAKVKNLFLYVETHKYPFRLPDYVFSLRLEDFKTAIANINIDQLPQVDDIFFEDDFAIIGDCEQCGSEWNAKCETDSGVWINTILITEDNYTQIYSPKLGGSVEGLLFEFDMNKKRYKKFLARR